MNYYAYVLIDPRTCQPFYVGKGKNKRMYDHWKHRRANCAGNKSLKIFLCNLEKCGLKPVYVKVLKDVSETAAFQKEKELIKQYGRFDLGTGFLLNLTEGGEGVTWSLEAKLQKSRKELAKKKGKPVSQYDLDGKLIQKYSSAKVASECVGSANRSYITQCCKGKRKSAGGFQWKYSNDAPPQKYCKQFFRKVKQYDLQGNYLCEFESLTAAAKTIDVNVRTLSKACSGHSKTSGGFVWRYSD